MKIIVYLFLLLLSIGCVQKDTKLFQSIDYSYFFGYFYSVKIYDNGKTFINVLHEPKSYFYSLNLSMVQMDSLSELIKKVESIKIDSVIIAPEGHGQTFCLIINRGNLKKQIVYRGDYEYQNLTSLYNLVYFLDDLNSEIQKIKDTSFIFESRSKLILPPPPPIEQIKN